MPKTKTKEKAKAKAAPSRERRRPWSTDDVRKLKSLSRESAPAIAEQLGRTVGAVYQQAAKRSVHIGTGKRTTARRTAPKAASKAAKNR
jgi:hypothetical protein